MKSQPIDKIVIVYIFLKMRRVGICLEDMNKDFFYDCETINIGLRIISTFYKKSLLPRKDDMEMFLDFLYSNINYSLDNDTTKSLQMFLSQFFLYSHNDLKKNTKNFVVYSEFICKLYKFCYGNLSTDLFEIGVQVVQILLNVSKGEMLRKNMSNIKLI